MTTQNTTNTTPSTNALLVDLKSIRPFNQYAAKHRFDAAAFYELEFAPVRMTPEMVDELAREMTSGKQLALVWF